MGGTVWPRIDGLTYLQPRLKRGDIVTVITQGNSVNPSPALAVQADAFDALAMVALLP